jgi:hypothetical protein
MQTGSTSSRERKRQKETIINKKRKERGKKEGRT